MAFTSPTPHTRLVLAHPRCTRPTSPWRYETKDFLTRCTRLYCHATRPLSLQTSRHANRALAPALRIWNTPQVAPIIVAARYVPVDPRGPSDLNECRCCHGASKSEAKRINSLLLVANHVAWMSSTQSGGPCCGCSGLECNRYALRYVRVGCSGRTTTTRVSLLIAKFHNYRTCTGASAGQRRLRSCFIAPQHIGIVSSL